MVGGNWMPGKELEIRQLAVKWMGLLASEESVAQFGWGKAEVENMIAEIKRFENALTAFEALDSSSNRKNKDEAKKAVVSVMRDFANSHIRFNRKMSENEKEAFGIKPGGAEQDMP